MLLRAYTDSIQWLARQENLDKSFMVSGEGLLCCVLLDGVSSNPNSRKCLDIVEEFFKNHELKRHVDPTCLLYDLNQAVLSGHVHGDVGYAAATAVIISEDGILWSNIWDVRIYEIGSQYLNQVSEDHISPFEKNAITKFLGMKWDQEENAPLYRIPPTSKRLLICTDGLWDSMESNLLQYHQILNLEKIQDVQKWLRKSVVESKNPDDSSYILIDIS